MSAIVSNEYREAEARLANDPITGTMASELLASGLPLSTFAHDSGTPRHEFMMRANDEYRRRGGRIEGHLGAVPTVVLAKVTKALAILNEASQA